MAEPSIQLYLSCVAVVEDYDYDADNDQNNPADDEQGSEDLPEIGTWGQKEDAADVKFGEALTYDQNQEIQLLVEKFSDIFSDRPGDTNLAEHRIDLTSDVPVRQTPYAVPFALRSSLRKELQQMEDLGIIRKSNSPYASPVVVVKKKDGSNRICIDFRRLNSITVTDPQPVPSPAESFLGMSEDKYFSKLDLTKGYHQIRVRPSDVHKTAFVTMGQHYEFLRMPFGMVNSGMTMTRAVRRLLEGMDNVVDYIDDLLVHTKTWEEHLQVLEELFKRLKAANLVARPTKCELGATQVDFLGHCLGRGTVGLQDCNVEKVKDAPRPTTKKEIRSFLGLVGYYQPFIPNFAAIAAPLSDLTRKGQPNKIVWGEPQERAYATLKKAVISKPILVLPDVNKEFVLRTDASDIGLGATLLQNRDGHIFPVAYAICGDVGACGKDQTSYVAIVCGVDGIRGKDQTSGVAIVCGDVGACGKDQTSGVARVCGDVGACGKDQTSGVAIVCGDVGACGKDQTSCVARVCGDVGACGKDQTSGVARVCGVWNPVVNADDSSLMSQSVLDNGQGDNSTDDLDIDMDDEVMTFMHSNIHRQLVKFTKKSAWGLGKKRQMMADDTKAYFQEVIRGAGLFGILTRSGSEDNREGRGAENFMDNFEDESWAELPEPRSATCWGVPWSTIRERLASLHNR
ncbi:hypothetical protein EGW08_022986 [Elysia chlorotica]|uniref:Reverse transcriptase domain-containing protein n=1 Tax=Elysia chlorotica TaxID=188477 RepID=A0A433SJK0_ELYCH|nr:hypothetical protein EGW08_022986 [Elysia chlorotica]